MATEQELQRMLDQVKAKVFMGDNAAFLGSIMCSLNFQWDTEIPTAATDGLDLRWNPEWFLKIPPKSRITVLLHELWHVAKLHMLRMEKRDAKIWNYACDIRINNDLEANQRTFEGVENCWKDRSIDKNGILAEEQIYDILYKDAFKIPMTGSWGQPSEGGDLEAGTGTVKKGSIKANQVLSAVVRAVQQAEAAGQAGQLPGDLKSILKSFLEPLVPWTTVLMQFFTDLTNEDYSWKRPNRRYIDMYLPSLSAEEGKLDEIAIFIDCSASVVDKQLQRFLSEVKYIQEVLRPNKLTIIQFDVILQNIKEYSLDEPMDEVRIHGRGGTSLEKVREWIEKNRPSAVVIFSDLEVYPMERPSFPVPILWARNKTPYSIIPSYGKIVDVKIEV